MKTWRAECLYYYQPISSHCGLSPKRVNCPLSQSSSHSWLLQSDEFHGADSLEHFTGAPGYACHVNLDLKCSVAKYAYSYASGNILAYPSLLTTRLGLLLNLQNALFSLVLGSDFAVAHVFVWSLCMEYSYCNVQRIACFWWVRLKLKYQETLKTTQCQVHGDLSDKWIFCVPA